MLRVLPFTTVTCVALAWVSLGAVADIRADKANQEARQLCEQVRMLGIAQDIDGLMQIVAVPFYLHGEKRTEVVRERDAVKAELQKFFADAPKDALFEVKRLLTCEQLLEEFEDKLTDDDRQVLGSVLKEGDRIVLIEVTSAGMRLDNIALLVGWRDGKAKLVGVRD